LNWQTSCITVPNVEITGVTHYAQQGLSFSYLPLIFIKEALLQKAVKDLYQHYWKLKEKKVRHEVSDCDILSIGIIHDFLNFRNF
jgi:hypothetical protein